jgi:IS30 family transposase
MAQGSWDGDTVSFVYEKGHALLTVGDRAAGFPYRPQNKLMTDSEFTDVFCRLIDELPPVLDISEKHLTTIGVS